MAILLAALVLLPACDRDKKDDRPAQTQARQAPAPKPVTYAEPEVVGILHAIDTTRIANGLAVRERSESESVLEFARVMRIDHRAMRALLDSILGTTNQTRAENAFATQLRTSGEQFLSELIAVDTGFNNKYIAREIADHELAIALMDTVLIRSATTPALKSALEQLKPAYQAHLQMAHEIRAAREAAAARRAAQAAPAVVPDTPRPRTDTLITTTGN